MSEKLKIAQTPIKDSQGEIEKPENVFFRFVTNESITYDIEVPANAGPLYALEQLKRTFLIGGENFCQGFGGTKAILRMGHKENYTITIRTQERHL